MLRPKRKRPSPWRPMGALSRMPRRVRSGLLAATAISVGLGSPMADWPGDLSPGLASAVLGAPIPPPPDRL